MIGIFDSGVGGMTVARSIELALPNYPVVYLGDIARTPYGSKSAAIITNYAIENSGFLVDKGAKVIVIACSSASSVATEQLRREFDVPIIEVITPAVREAAKVTRGRVGVIGTSATIRSESYPRLLTKQDPALKVYSKACPLLCPLVEEGWTGRRETKMILRRYLHDLKKHQIDTLILGCTHYPLLKHLIQPRIGKKVHLIDPAQATAENLKTFLVQNPVVKEEPSHTPEDNLYYVTDTSQSATEIATRIFQREMKLLPA
ncbi:glutamate racemase [Desulforhopalus singaporensis]|uniref:Glutamate racemase n=1 Tax=Desulforhopalus singaporensis TaxID=91360 RepID=A0A1H0TH74_9BACT|nr:glutamate racemase [Desulforhopalus singaporensis]SDP52928.1 glutamate racemase [Desulforhopalus singaporensis]